MTWKVLPVLRDTACIHVHVQTWPVMCICTCKQKTSKFIEAQTANCAQVSALFLDLLNSTLHPGSCGLSEGPACVTACGLYQWDWCSSLNWASFISVADLFLYRISPPGLLNCWHPPQIHIHRDIHSYRDIHLFLLASFFGPSMLQNCQLAFICILISLDKRNRTSALHWINNVNKHRLFCLNSHTILSGNCFVFSGDKLAKFDCWCLVLCNSVKKLLANVSKDYTRNTLS